MNVLLIGSGGREHALSIKITESSLCSKLYVSPGNAGTLSVAENVDLNINSFESVVNFCIKKDIELVIIGPEKSLVEGLADELRKNNINVFGPSKNAARIEGDKSFSKNLMKGKNIPTADYVIFDKKEYSQALQYLKKSKYPIVIKASGLAAGKGVVIADNFENASKALEDCMLNSVFGESGHEVVIEEFLTGDELSVFAVTDGENFVILPPSQDHKRIGEGDTGKNTGGMGAYAPLKFVNDELLKTISEKIIKPTLKGLKEVNSAFNGCLYCGLIKTEDGIKVIEFNCRFGDPETQAVLQLLDGDFLQLLYSAAIGKIDKKAVKYNGGAAVCVVSTSGGYPGEFTKGYEIFGLDTDLGENVKIIHAGTSYDEGKIITSGGRVLNIVSFSRQNDLMLCITNAYDILSKVKYTNIYYRKDIGSKALKSK